MPRMRRAKRHVHLIMPDRKSIKRFVQETLGCGCAEEVFDIIECDENVGSVPDVVIKYKINIGNRLLIYALDPDDEDVTADLVKSLAMAGQGERNKRGFNRFRLVIAMENPDGRRDSIESVFNDRYNSDPKMHVHVIDKGELF